METRGDGGSLGVEIDHVRITPRTLIERRLHEQLYASRADHARCLRAEGHAAGHLRRFLRSGNSDDVVMALGYLEASL